MNVGLAVWVRAATADGPEAFVLGSVAAADGEEVIVTVPTGGTRVLHVSDCMPANPPGMTAPDNAQLIHLSEPTILANMHARYQQQYIYTYVGSILLAVNPFERLTALYSTDVMSAYAGKVASSQPHVYAIADAAYRDFKKSGHSQSLVVSGESGAGKTETNKHLMQYIAWRSNSVGGAAGGPGDLATAVLQANPVLEAFGNAKTSRNNNSSRFGKFLKIAMRRAGCATALAHTYRQRL